MVDAVCLYARYVAVSFRSQMQYRASFVMQSIGQFVINGIEFLVLWALFHRFGSIGGWSLPEVAVLYGLVNTEWSLTDATSRAFDTFGTMVKSGEFDRVLLRPRSTVLQLAGQELTLRRIGRFGQGFAALVWGLSAVGIVWSPAKALLLVAAILSGWAFFYGLIMIQATMCFWTTETLEVMNAFTYGGCETARLPMHIYGRWFRRFFAYVIPLAAGTYFPALALLDRADPFGTPRWVYWLAPTLGFVFLAIATRIWRFGVRRYRSTGS